jgi:hypothetical protein
MNPVYRPWWVYGIGTAVLLLALFFFAVVTGWPATPDSCIAGGNCYCEHFSRHAVEIGARGLRQPVNTLSNLYALITAGIVAYVMMSDRRDGASGNVMKSNSPIGDAYVFAVLFLGLGSMWFHASISKSVSWMDGFSMYVYAGFLVFYTLDRWLAHRNVAPLVRNLVFWICWPALAIILTIIGAAGADSLYLIIGLVVIYAALDFFGAGWIGFRDTRALVYWIFAVVAIGLAVLFWVLSKTGGALCHPHSWFQPHGLLWHTLAGVMAVLMYFYWRRETPATPTP